MPTWHTSTTGVARFKITYSYPLLMTWDTELPAPGEGTLPQRLFDLDFLAPLYVGLSAATGATSYFAAYAPGGLPATLVWPGGYCGYPVGIGLQAWGPYGGYDTASYEVVVLPPGTSCVDTTPDPGPWDQPIAVNGYFEVAFDARVVFADYVPDNAIEIDGTMFPEVDGGAVPDGLEAKGGTWYLIPKVGGTITVTNTSNDVTASVSEPIDPFLNLASYRAYLGGLNNVHRTESASLSGVATFEFTGFDDPKPLAADFEAEGDSSSVTWTTAGAWDVTATGASIEDERTVTITALVGPTTEYQINGILRVVGQGPTEAYPDSLTLRVRYKDLQDIDLTMSPGATFLWSQFDWQITAEENGITIGSEAVDEVAPVKAFLKATQDGAEPTLISRVEDARDQRWQWQFFPWEALQISQDASTLVASIDVDVTKDAPQVVLSQTNWEGYRYLSVPYTFTADRVLTLTHGGKKYKLPVANGSGTALIDLLLPSNVPGSLKKDERDGRWPLEEGPTSIPGVTTDLPLEKRGWLSGPFERPTEITIGGIQDGETLSIGPISLVREEEARMGVYLPFQNEKKVWDSPTDNTFADLDLALWSDDRLVGPVPFRFHVKPLAGGGSYEYLTLIGLESFIDGTLAGWSATVQPSPADSPYDPDDPLIKLLDGSNAAGNLDGYLWNPDAGTLGEWVDQTNLEQGATLLSCLKLDEFQGWPSDKPWELPGSKILRMRSGGNLFARATGARADETDVIELVSNDGGTSYGLGSTNDRGAYRTRTPWAFGNRAVRTRLVAKPEVYEAEQSANRWYIGPSFTDPKKGIGVHLATEYNTGIILLTSTDAEVTTRSFDTPGGIDLTANLGEADSAQGVIGPDGTFSVFLSRENAIYLRESFNQGETWGDEMAITTGTNPAPETEQFTGIRYLAKWEDEEWRLWRKLPAEDWEDVSLIATGPESAAGLRQDPTQEGTLIFAYDDGDGPALRASYNHGDTWEDL